MIEDGGTGRAGRTNALEVGREAVRGAIAAAVEVGAITTEAAGQYTTEMQQVGGDEYALHEWVQGYDKIARRFCRYPGCFEPPRPRKEGVKGGASPQYCEVVRDAHGEPAHTAQKSFAFRSQLHAGGPREPVVTEAANPLVERPVASARAMVPATVERLAELMEGLQAAIAGHVDEVRRSLAHLGDDEARQVEFEAIQAEADGRVKAAQDAERQATQRARKAESDTARATAAEREALGAAQEMAEQVQQIENRRIEQERLDQGRVENAQEAERAAVEAMNEANQRAVDAEAKAAQEIREANEAANERIAAAEVSAKQRIQEANTAADQRVKAAEDQATKKVQEANKAADERVRAARAEADAARKDRDEKVAAAGAATARAEQGAADARTELGNAREDLVAIRAELQVVRAKLDEEVARTSAAREELATIRAELKAERSGRERDAAAATTRLDEVRAEARAEAERRVKDVSTAKDEQLNELRTQLRAATEESGRKKG